MKKNNRDSDSDKGTSTRGYSTMVSALAFQARDEGSIPFTRSKFIIPDRWVKLAYAIRVSGINHVFLAGVNNRVRIKKKLP